MAARFSEHLPHFAVSKFGEVALGGLVHPLGAPAPPPPDEGRSEAEVRAIHEAVAAARAEFERQRSEDRADFEFRLAEAEQKFAEETAGRLAERLEAAIGEMRSAIGGHVAAVLSHFLEGAVRHRAIDELAETVGALLVEGAARVRIAGPENLLERLKPRLVPLGGAVEYATVGGNDVTVRVDDTVIETRIAAWAERLAGNAGVTDV